MTHNDESGGVSALVRHTAGMAELAINAGHPDRKHNEFLPYPDNNFHETIDERYQRGEKLTVEHIKSQDGQAFVANIPVYVTCLNAERVFAGFAEFLNPYLYCITTRHGPFQWVIYKRYRHFHDLHKALVQFVQAETRRPIDTAEKNQDENPCFPTRNDRTALINESNVQERCQILMKYLNSVLRHPKFRAHPALREFFAVSCLSFVHGLSVSQKEGFLIKRSHDKYRGNYILFRLPFRDSCKCYHDRKWFAIKDTYIAYLRPDLNELRFPLLVDRGFEFVSGIRNAGSYHGIKIKNLQRTLVVKCRTTRDCDEWFQHLTNLKAKASGFVNDAANRFNSYAPVREKQLAYWFINGKSYMEAVAKALLTAKEEVFITDWWLSPEVMLIRPADDETSRLDNLLGKIADSGVRVYIMVFKEMSIAIGLNSLYTKKVLTSKSKQGFIKVIRHPKHRPNGGVFLWSHHEKMVVIDQKIAFVGGIDLCYGRWDDEYMRLVDLGEENDRTLKMPSEIFEESAAAGGIETVEATEKATLQMAEQADIKPIKTVDNLRTAFTAPSKPVENAQPARNSLAVTSPYSVTTVAKKWIESKLQGPNTEEGYKDLEDDPEAVSDQVLDDSSNNRGLSEIYSRKWRKLAQKMRKYSEAEEDSDDENHIEESPASNEPIPTVDRKQRYFIGKDYANAYEKDFAALERYNEDFIDRKTVPRMPWHDEAIVVFGAAARDVARHFIQRWNMHKCEKYSNNPAYPFLLPKSYDDVEELTVKNWKDFLEGEPYKVNAQCVRSVGPWSISTRTVESSIQNAYIQMIAAAEHYIYIENQFFITIAQDPQVRNQLAEVLFRRIEQAHKAGAKFRIYIVLPLFPGFDNLNAVQAVLYFIMRSISKGDSSLFKRLERAGILPDDYISIFGMRNHDILMGNLVTEIIYVHSKLMIIDDCMAICGSANINDRSLLGQRDSEFCVVISDVEKEDSVFNGKQVRVGKFCSSWRKNLFAMLLGILQDNPNKIDISDPVSDEFYFYFRAVARKNTLIYEEVFSTIPNDKLKTFEQITRYTAMQKLKDTDPIRAHEKLKGVQGFIVEYPLYFLDDEDYLPSKSTREGMVPTVTWT